MIMTVNRPQFNAALKVERVHRTAYPTRKKAKEDIARYIELRYSTYSEIVWLRTDWTASTRANANRTTGLPNSYPV
jgi:hypothetical protein